MSSRLAESPASLASLSTGCAFIDKAIGGLPCRAITHIYGAASVGKSTLAMEAYLGVARQGCGCFVIDCGGSYNPRRLLQLCGSAPLPAHRITLFRPRTFEEQSELIAKLHLFLDPTVRLIVVDPITNLYRRQVTPEAMTALYRELAERQLPRLVGLARDNNLAVIVVNQISTWNGEDHPVGGDAIHRYAALEIYVDRFENNSTSNRWLVLSRPHDPEPHRRILAELHESGFKAIKAFSASPSA